MTDNKTTDLEKKNKMFSSRHTYLNKLEKFDRHKLNYIINNQEFFKKEMRKKCFNHGRNPFNEAKEYLKKSKYGFINIKYRQKFSQGRLFAINSSSLQGMPREIRHTISKDFYVDIDIVNAHPVILEHLCISNGFGHKSLSYYIENREKIFKTLKKKGVGREISKSIFLSILNGGTNLYNSHKDKHEFIKDFKNEIDSLHLLFSKFYKDEYEEFIEKKNKEDKKDKDDNDDKTFNLCGKFVNALLCDTENKILLEILNFYGNDNNAVLCFDGIMLPRVEGKNYELKKCSSRVKKKLGINISLKIKDMDEGFEIKENIPEYEPATDEDIYVHLQLFDDLKKLIIDEEDDDSPIAKIFQKVIKSDVYIVDDNKGFLWNSKTLLWEEKSNNYLSLLISDHNKNFGMTDTLKTLISFFETTTITDKKKKKKKKKKDDDDDDEDLSNSYVRKTRSLLSYLTSSAGCKNTFIYIKSALTDENFNNKINRAHDYYPMRNGKILNLITGEIRMRNKTDLFSFECPVSIIDRKDWTAKDTKLNNDFIHQILAGDTKYIDYMKIKMGSYLSGKCYRDIDINHGGGKNGKSSLINALKKILSSSDSKNGGDGFFGFINKCIITHDGKPSSKNASSHTSGLIPMDGKRLIVSQELKEEDILDSEIIKKIASNDPIEGVREAYGKKTYTMYPFCKLVICSNHIPNFDVSDTAMTDRLNFHPFNARFLDKEGLEREKEEGKYNPLKYSYYKADKKMEGIFKTDGRHVDIFFSWLAEGCKDFYRLYDDGIPKPDLVKQYINQKVNENDFVSQWITANCDVIPHVKWASMSKFEKSKYFSPTSDLFEDFKDWCQDNTETPYGKKKFYKHLDMRHERIRKNKKLVYARIQLKPEEIIFQN